jgi:hypothetical protein
MVKRPYAFLDWRLAVWAMGIDDVDVAELEALEGRFGAFNNVLPGETDVIDAVSGRREA